MITVHAGHAPAYGLGCGAVGILNESLENRKVLRELKSRLAGYGVEYKDVTVNEHMNAEVILTRLNKAMNAADADYNLSIHLNSSVSASANGVECIVYSSTSKARDMADVISKAIASELGIKNRGVKYNPGLSILKNTKKPTVIIECCFVTSPDDNMRWDAERCAKAIALACASYLGAQSEAPPSVPESQSPDEAEENVLYKVQVGAFADKSNADRLCKTLLEKGYNAYVKKEVR